ncbi:MAG: hypothetical protein PHH23_01555 [Paludibacteraceae bacterium]|nr:hypothetical protein [Paludibacteraceae bacterium]
MAEKQNFLGKPHLCCGEDTNRPNLQRVYFIDGYAYASDAHCLIKQSLFYYTKVINYELLEGHSIHRNSFENILKFQIAQANDEGIECWDENGKRAFFPYNDENYKGDNVPGFEAILNHNPIVSLPEIGIDATLVDKVSKAFAGNNKGFKLQFCGIDKPMRCYCVGYEEQEAVIMPMVLEETIDFGSDAD